MLSFEQVATITVLTAILSFIFNFTFEWIKNKLAWFENTKKFKRDHSYQQLKTLYFSLYAIVCQSEYLRSFFEIKQNKKEFPFIELEQRKEIKKHTFDFENLDFSNFTFNTTEFEVSNVITEFNKKRISETIIDNKEYASQKLLKLAVAYRFVHDYYTDETLDSKEILEKFQDEEIKLIWVVVKTVIKETNEKLKLCNMDYDKKELKSGEMFIKF